MKYAVTGTQMKQIDQDTIEGIGIPSVVLMERAALAVADAAQGLALKKMKRDKKPIQFAVICGTGNNGADGIGAGRILWGRGYEVILYLAGDPQRSTPEYQLQKHIAEQLQIPTKPADRFPNQGEETVIDALFGIGLVRNVEGEYKRLIEKMASRADLVAVDIPSGIHADTGAVMGAAAFAAVTVTFGYLKSGLLLYPGKSYGGQVKVKDIGFFDCSRKRVGWDAKVLEKTDLTCLPKRPSDGNKGTFGKVLVVAGSVGMCGAAYLSGLAAYRIGTGLVRILTVKENRPVLQAKLPEAIVDVLDERIVGIGSNGDNWAGGMVQPDGMFESDENGSRDLATAPEMKGVKDACAWADAVVLGPGLGQDFYVEKLVETVLACAKVPVVLDADGINTVARCPHLKRYLNKRVVLTPHMGEMARLTGWEIEKLKADRVKAAKSCGVKTGAITVLKDASTVIANGEGMVYINSSGCSAMAKAGSGDVLAGAVGGLLAQGMEPLLAAAYGVFIHGLAGEHVRNVRGEGGLLAGELADALGEIKR